MNPLDDIQARLDSAPPQYHKDIDALMRIARLAAEYCAVRHEFESGAEWNEQRWQAANDALLAEKLLKE